MIRQISRIAATAILTLSAGVPALAQEGDGNFRFSSEVTLGFDYYAQAGLFNGQSGAGVAPYASARLRADTTIGDWDGVFEFYGRGDPNMDNGTLDLPRFHISRNFGSWDLVLGSNISYWGVSEAHHAVNAINQRDHLAPQGQVSFLGQPMVNA